ncbi:MAG: MaoC family dehydratase N-terminal domain-containing protein [Bacilli bacterium]
MDNSIVGVWSQPVANVVERGAVRKFADAIGDPNPLYRDEEYARGTRFGRLIAPPTFCRTFDFGIIEGLDIAQEGLIHGEQSFHFERPIYVGEELWCSECLADTYTRSGGSGKMTFLILEQKGETKGGELVFTSRANVIRKEGPDA